MPGGAVDLDQLVCDGKTLRGSIEPTTVGGSSFIAQVTLYSAALGVAISQACYAPVRTTSGLCCGSSLASWIWRAW